jgi:hypothetical protein
MAVARSSDPDGMYRITEGKHFGSCSGIAFFMITITVMEGEKEPDPCPWTCKVFRGTVLPVAKLAVAWDGGGMTAMQSHAFNFQDSPDTRPTWPGPTAKTQDWRWGILLLVRVLVIGRSSVRIFATTLAITCRLSCIFTPRGRQEVRSI